jgi:hypothetical protein
MMNLNAYLTAIAGAAIAAHIAAWIWAVPPAASRGRVKAHENAPAIPSVGPGR